MKNTNIQWCDSTINPRMGCNGCELWKPAVAIIALMVTILVQRIRKPKAAVTQVIAQAVGERTTSELYRDRQQVAADLAARFSLTGEQQRELVNVVRRECKCYAGLLGTFRAGHKGYADKFEAPKLYPGRMAKAARLNPPEAKERRGKPWLNGLPRLIFISDMGDALSAPVPFDYLLSEIIESVENPMGRRHIWLWLTKRPEQMAEFAGWLQDRGISWPQNLVPMATVTMQRYAGRVDQLRRVPSRLRALSLEPLFEPVDLDLQSIDWVIVGGGSDVLAEPFHLEWAMNLRKQCQEAGVAFFLKQLGRKPFYENRPLPLKDKHGGDWAEWPEPWRVREMPQALRGLNTGAPGQLASAGPPTTIAASAPPANGPGEPAPANLTATASGPTNDQDQREQTPRDNPLPSCNDGLRPGSSSSELAEVPLHNSAGSPAGAYVSDDELLPSCKPWPDPVDGVGILDEIGRRIALYLALPPGAADVMALWAAHAHAFQAFCHTPRLNLTAPERGCGKTTALNIMGTLTPRPLHTENVTPAVLFRLVERSQPTLLLDEVETFLLGNEELRGLMNSGHERGGRAYRCEGGAHTIRGFSSFAPAALAGIGELPGTIHDRSIVVHLMRAKRGEVVRRFDARRIEAETELCRKLARWSADSFQRLEACEPELPPEAYNRLGDNWRPIFAVAQVAGGAWPERARQAFAWIARRAHQEGPSLGEMLLADIATVFAETGLERTSSASLTAKLGEFEGRPWAEFGPGHMLITPNQLAFQLAKFDVRPAKWRIGNTTERGYIRTTFGQAFERFLPNGGR